MDIIPLEPVLQAESTRNIIKTYGSGFSYYSVSGEHVSTDNASQDEWDIQFSGGNDTLSSNTHTTLTRKTDDADVTPPKLTVGIGHYTAIIGYNSTAEIVREDAAWVSIYNATTTFRLDGDKLYGLPQTINATGGIQVIAAQENIAIYSIKDGNQYRIMKNEEILVGSLNTEPKMAYNHPYLAYVSGTLNVYNIDTGENKMYTDAFDFPLVSSDGTAYALGGSNEVIVNDTSYTPSIPYSGYTVLVGLSSTTLYAANINGCYSIDLAMSGNWEVVFSSDAPSTFTPSGGIKVRNDEVFLWGMENDRRKSYYIGQDVHVDTYQTTLGADGTNRYMSVANDNNYQFYGGNTTVRFENTATATIGMWTGIALGTIIIIIIAIAAAGLFGSKY